MKTVTFLLPSHWASYLINGDASSFSLDDDGDEQIAAIDTWMRQNHLGFCIDCAEAGFCWRNDGPDGHLGADCMEFTFEDLS